MQFAGSGGNAAMSVALQGCDYIQKAITTSAFHIRRTVASLSYYIVLATLYSSTLSRCSASTSHEYNYTANPIKSSIEVKMYVTKCNGTCPENSKYPNNVARLLLSQ